MLFPWGAVYFVALASLKPRRFFESIPKTTLRRAIHDTLHFSRRLEVLHIQLGVA